jgi:heme exporter protein A
MADGSAPLLRAAGLEGQRGERVLFRGLELNLEPGNIVWLRGRNGRGKTTLLRLLAGLASPAGGEIAFRGTALPKAGAAWRADMAYIGHANALKDDLSATEALRFIAGLRGREPDAKTVAQALARLGVADRARAAVRTLSQGQRRRVALARLALSITPALWLLDEPFDALDVDGIATLNTLLSEHAARGGAALLTSHQALSLKDPVPRELGSRSATW